MEIKRSWTDFQQRLKEPDTRRTNSLTDKQTKINQAKRKHEAIARLKEKESLANLKLAKQIRELQTGQKHRAEQLGKTEDRMRSGDKARKRMSDFSPVAEETKDSLATLSNEEEIPLGVLVQRRYSMSSERSEYSEQSRNSKDSLERKKRASSTLWKRLSQATFSYALSNSSKESLDSDESTDTLHDQAQEEENIAEDSPFDRPSHLEALQNVRRKSSRLSTSSKLRNQVIVDEAALSEAFRREDRAKRGSLMRRLVSKSVEFSNSLLRNNGSLSRSYQPGLATNMTIELPSVERVVTPGFAESLLKVMESMDIGESDSLVNQTLPDEAFAKQPISFTGHVKSSLDEGGLVADEQRPMSLDQERPATPSQFSTTEKPLPRTPHCTIL